MPSGASRPSPGSRSEPRWFPARHVWLTAIALAVATALLVPASFGWTVRAAAAWDVATLALLGLSWWGILYAGPAATRRRAAAADPGRVVLLFSAIGTSTVALVAAVALLSAPRGESPGGVALRLALGVWAVSGAWALLHTAYALHYSHLYYRGDPNQPGGGAHGGLVFPGGAPAAVDFAYFAFTIGMTFQTSDVTISSRTLRRWVLGHSVLSFGFNTVILALTVSLLGGAFGQGS
jgi:uncharacterized membrane protein